MLSFSRFSEFSEYFLQRGTANDLFGLRSDADGSQFVVLSQVALSLQILNKIPHPVVIRSNAVLLVQLVHPSQRLGGVARCIVQQLGEKLQQIIEISLRQLPRNIFGKSISPHPFKKRQKRVKVYSLPA